MKRFTYHLLAVFAFILAFNTAAQPPQQLQRLEKGTFTQALSPHKFITKSFKASNGINATTAQKRTNKAKEGQPTYQVDFVLDFDAEHGGYVYDVRVDNKENHFRFYDLDLFDPVCGSNVVSLPAGTYDMLFSFVQLDTLESNYIYKVVIRENVTVDHDMQLNFSANEATNRIHHEIINPEGEALKIGSYIYDNGHLTPIDPGNVDDILVYNAIVCSDYGIAYDVNENVGVKAVSPDGEIVSQGNWATSDIFVNDVSDRYSFYLYRMAFKDHQVFNTAFETVGAHGDVTYTNDPANYVEYDVPFKAPYHHGEKLYPVLMTYALPKQFDWAYIPGFVLDPIVEGDAIKFYLDAKVEDSPAGNIIPYIQLDYSKKIATDWGHDYLPVVGTTPLTNTQGNIVLANNGTSSYLTINGLPRGFNWDLNEEGTSDYSYDYWPTHPSFSYPVEKAKGIIGNNCPIFVNNIMRDYWEWDETYCLRFNIGYLGRYGEISEGISDAQISITLDGEEFINTQGAFEYYAPKLPAGVVDVTITNELVEVDDLPGSNKAQLHYIAGEEDDCSPTMTMLHFKDNNGDVTDRFATGDEGTMEFTAGDFNYIVTPWETGVYNRYTPESVEVSYSPYGEDNWNELAVEEVPENYWPVMGWFYTGSLASVTGEAYKGWFDLKIRLTDAAGNWQEQVLSPAFRIDNLAYSSVANVGSDNAREVARYSIDGKRVDASHHGVTIVKMSDGTAKKIVQ